MQTAPERRSAEQFGAPVAVLEGRRPTWWRLQEAARGAAALNAFLDTLD